MSTTITALGANQRTVLDWMLGKPNPEGYEHVGIELDEEWFVYVEEVDRVGPSEVRSITLRDEHVEPFLAECENGVDVLAGNLPLWRADYTDDDRQAAAESRALGLLVERVRKQVSA